MANPSEPPVEHPHNRTIQLEFVTIASAIRDLAKGQGGPTTLHNAEAAVHRLAALSRSVEAQRAGADLRRALADLARDPERCAADLAAGLYPVLVDDVEKALERLRRRIA